MERLKRHDSHSYWGEISDSEIGKKSAPNRYEFQVTTVHEGTGRRVAPTLRRHADLLRSAAGGYLARNASKKPTRLELFQSFFGLAMTMIRGFLQPAA